MASLGVTFQKANSVHVHMMGWVHNQPTVPLETMGPFARGKTSSLPNVTAANSPRWDENRNRGKDESNRKPRGIRRGNASVKIQ